MPETAEPWRWQYADARAIEVPLTPIAFDALPGWKEDDHLAAFRCFAKSGARILAPFPLVEPSNSLEARNFFERYFVAFQVEGGPGLLTAYYEPLLQGSWREHRPYTVPVYRRPSDLVALPQGHALAEGGLTAARASGEAIVPYFTRAEIDDGALSGLGLELLFVKDPIACYVMHVQGSGAVALEEGGVVRIGFDGKNGHPYASIGKLLVARGELTPEAATLDRIVAWLEASPRRGAALLRENKSYIFFKELARDAAAPVGSLAAPLTAWRSLAADPRCHRLGLPIFVSAPELEFEGRPFRRLLVAQDTGSAIVGAKRGDLFAGSGPEAGAVAGRIRHVCEFAALLPKGEV